MRSVARFTVAAIPFAVLVLLLNQRLYGSPFRTGYGQLENLFSQSVVATNAARYLGWLMDTHTPFPLLAFAAPFGVAKERRPDTLLALALVGAACVIYFLYTPFDDWSYLRFLLPAIALMIVLASVSTVRVLETMTYHHALVGVITAVLAVFCIRAASERHAFALQFLEQRYRSAGKVVQDLLPPDAVVLSVWDSGAVRFHGRKEALSWEALDPTWLDRTLQWLEVHGRPPFILVESWEEPGFRSRFSQHSNVGKLDWPPKYEIDRVVRIFDPRDRERYHRGERVDTEFVWPLRD
jgi:hypothetical protein